MIKIVEADNILIKKTEELVSKVFPSRSFSELLSFWAYKYQNNWFVKASMSLCGFSSPMKYWVAINDDGDVCGTTGIYSYTKDKHEAVWMAWFCVDPEHRGQGIGKHLIKYASIHGNPKAAN